MQKSKFKILLCVLLALLLITSYCLASTEPAVDSDSIDSETTTSEESPVLTSEEESENDLVVEDEDSSWLNSDLYTINSKVDVAKVVDGNAFIIGNEVTISGEIGGDVFVIANKLTIDGGYVYSSIFALANEITINGIAYDLYAACNNLTIGKDGFIYRDLKALASNVNISGKIRRNAQIASNKITFAEDLGELVSGDLNYYSNEEISIPDGVVAGEVKYQKTTETENTTNPILSNVLNLLEVLIFALIITLLLIWLAPKFVDKLNNITTPKAFSSLGIGLLAIIGYFIAICVILMLVFIIQNFASIFGKTLIFLIFIFVILSYLGTAVTNIFFGKIFVKKLKMEGKAKLILFTLISNLIIWLVTKIPFIGGIISLFATAFGIGLIISKLPWKKEKTNKEN